MKEFAADLRRTLADEPIHATPPTRVDRTLKWVKRNPTRSTAAAIAAVAFVAISLLLVENVRARNDLSTSNQALAAKTTEALTSAAESRENARVAKANEARATEEKERADREAGAATRKTDEVLRLSALQDLDDLLAKADELWPPYPERIPAYAAWIADARRLVAELPVHRSKRAELRSRALPHGAESPKEEVDDAAEAGAPAEERRDWTFPEEEREARWWNNQLTKLIDGLEGLESGLLAEDGTSEAHGWSVPKRLAFARSLDAGFAPGGEYERAWAAALPEIHAEYPGLELSPQLGLVPIGPDPDSGLWEFAHLQTGAIAERGPDGKLILTQHTGIVLVLLPGGTFWMGAQGSDPAKPNYDPQVESDEALHRVKLSPFFLSKYEMTQGQWRSVTGKNPSYWGPGDLLPVEQVNWLAGMETCRRLGLSLPSEAQWEYGARAGTDTRWWSGEDPELLAEVANLADQSFRNGGGLKDRLCASWDDGAYSTSDVGRYAANLFGLHDVHGNVWEMCLDVYGVYPFSSDPLIDPVCSTGAGTTRVNRGGSYDDAAVNARAADRYGVGPEVATYALGLRLARTIAP